MTELDWSGLPATRGRVGVICACLPGFLLSRGDVAAAGAAIEEIVAASGGGLVPGNLTRTARDGAPDAEGNLWFVRAAQAFRQVAGEQETAAYHGRVAPLIKRIIQACITGEGWGRTGTRMDDGGLLVVEGSGSRAMRINGLWYHALETAGVTLREMGDPMADHFERLAWRFRRSFAKQYWCDEHGFVCGPEARKREGHGADLPDGEQLLFVMLPSSPFPRTKQRQIVQAMKARLVGQVGMKLGGPGEATGRESALHRAWLAEGLVLTAESRASVLGEARELMRPLQELLAARGAVAAEYADGKAVGRPDAVATAEVMGVINRLQRD
jgi:hypothetical protein